MNPSLAWRLNQILPRITSATFLSSEGIGNEIACYIFDYPAKDELLVREHIEIMRKRLASHHKALKVLHLNLLKVSVDYLEHRDLYDKVLKMQKAKGDTAVLRALKGPMSAAKIRDFIADQYQPEKYDLLLLSGVGSVWPMLRAHSLLNCMHTVMRGTPLLMFYPGSFDGTSLRLFGQILANPSSPGTKSYYRAFTLVPKGGEA